MNALKQTQMDEAADSIGNAAIALEGIAHTACDAGDPFKVYRAMQRAMTLRNLERNLRRGFI